MLNFTAKNIVPFKCAKKIKHHDLNEVCSDKNMNKTIWNIYFNLKSDKNDRL